MQMSDFKIPGGPKESPSVDVVEDLRDAVETASRTTEVEASVTRGIDAVEQIAADVAAGSISREEAVDRLLANVLDSAMVQSAPKALREGLKEVLETLLESDPHLGSLIAAIGPREIE